MTKAELCSSILDTLNSYNRRMYQYGKNYRNYGTSTLLRIDQIQLINLIGAHQDINLSTLAELAKINVSTLSLQVNRLVKLGLLTKDRAPTSQREIVINLTAEGLIAYEFHKQLDENYFLTASQGLSCYSEKELEIIDSFMHNLEAKDLNL